MGLLSVSTSGSAPVLASVLAPLHPPVFLSRPNGSPAATPCPTLTWTRAACATTPACVSAATLFPVAACTRATLSRWPSGRSATATRTACCRCGREKVRRSGDACHVTSVCASVTDVPLCSCTRVNPSLHHRAPAGKTCAALHQPSECCLQDLHQVRKSMLSGVCRRV